MAINRENALLDITGTAIHNRVKEQGWFKENANFVTSAAGFLVTVAAWAATQSFAEDPRVQFGILILGFLGTVFGVKKTRNGFSKSQLQKIRNDQAAIIGSTPLVQPDLDAEVEAFNAHRE